MVQCFLLCTRCTNVCSLLFVAKTVVPDLLPKLQVDKGAIKFLMKGSNIMCPGLTSPGASMEDVESDTICAIMAEGKQHALGIGITLMSTEEMYASNNIDLSFSLAQTREEHWNWRQSLALSQRWPLETSAHRVNRLYRTSVNVSRHSPTGCARVAMVPERVCIVGTGISGLSAAYVLSSKFDVTLVEKEGILGMDAQSVDLPLGQGDRMDTPPRALSPEYYSNLWSLYRHAGVPVEHFDWSFCYCEQGAPSPYFRVCTALQLAGCSVPDLSCVHLPTAFRIIRDALSFYAAIRKDLPLGKLEDISLRAYLEKHGYSHDYVYKSLLPMLCTTMLLILSKLIPVAMVCTCTYEAVLQYPCSIIAEYLLQAGIRTQYRSKFGSSQVIRALSRNVSRIILNAKVLSVGSAQDASTKPWVKFQNADGDIETESFDYVIVASQAHDAKDILTYMDEDFKSVLSEFPHEDSVVVVHQDSSFMPSNRENWSPMNFTISRDNSAGMFTMWMAKSGGHDNVFQTWNPLYMPRESELIRKIVFSRPVVTLSSLSSMNRLKKLQGRGGLYFCGAYCLPAVPLQENGVKSALHVASLLGVESPWKGLESVPRLEPQFRPLYDAGNPIREFLNKDSSSTWMCFGFWKDISPKSKDFQSACESLSKLVGSAAELSRSDQVLDVGFGCGDQIKVWTESFGVSRIDGIDAVVSQVNHANEIIIPQLPGCQIKLIHGSATSLEYPDSSFDKVVSLDAPYHFDSRLKFFEESFRVLRSGGRLAAVDIAFDLSSSSFVSYLIHHAFQVPLVNFGSLSGLKSQLVSAGFEQVDVQDISKHVVSPFFSFVGYKAKCCSSFSEYVVVFKLVVVCLLLYVLQAFGLVKIALYTAKKSK